MLTLNDDKLLLIQKIFMGIYLCMLYALEIFRLYSAIFLLVLAIGSAVYFVLNIKTGAGVFKSYKIDLLILFTLINTISILINVKYGVTDNILSLFVIFVDFIIFYNIGYDKSEEHVNGLFSSGAHLLIFLHTIPSLFSLGLYSLQLSNVFFDNDRRFRHGFLENRLFGIFSDPNYSAVMCLVVIMLCIYFAFKNKDRFYRVLYYLAASFNICYMILSGSRTAVLSGIAAVFVGGYFFIFKKTEKRNKRSLRQIICILSAVAIAAASLISYEVIRLGLRYIPPVMSYITDSSEEKELNSVSLARADVEENKDYSNSRIKIWQSAFSIFFTKPLMGTSPRNMLTYAKSEMPQTYIATSEFAIHNSFFEVLVFNGILGFCAMALFLVYCAFYTFKHLFTKTNDHFPEVILGIMIVIVFMTAGLTLSGLFYNRGSYNMVFWFALGYLTFFTCPREESVCYKITNKIFKLENKKP